MFAFRFVKRNDYIYFTCGKHIKKQNKKGIYEVFKTNEGVEVPLNFIKKDLSEQEITEYAKTKRNQLVEDICFEKSKDSSLSDMSRNWLEQINNKTDEEIVADDVYNVAEAEMYGGCGLIVDDKCWWYRRAVAQLTANKKVLKKLASDSVEKVRNAAKEKLDESSNK